MIITVFPWQFLVITQSYRYNTENYVVLLQKPEKQPLEVFCKRSCSQKNFANFKGKHLCWSLFLIKLQAWTPAALLKRDPNTGAFLWNFQNC